MQLTTEQRTSIVLKFNETGSIPRVRREFEERFPERSSPDKKTILRTVHKFNNHGTILNRNKGNSGRKRTQRTPENIAIVRNIIEEDHQSSVRRNESNLHRSSFHRILKHDLHYHPYKKQIKHQLLEPDYPRRRVFSAWLQSRVPRFVKNLVMTDEAAFAMNGTVNTQNTRYWSEHRPAGNVFETSLRRGKVSVWAGICGNGAVIGPFFYDGALNGYAYNNMLQENIITSIRRTYGVRFRNCWFMQDGAPAHRRLTV